MPLDLYFDADWLPNAESFVYVTGGYSGDRIIMRLSVAGGQPVQLVADSGIEHLSIANHADVLVYSSKFHDHNLWRIPGPTSSNEVTPKRLAASTRDELMPSYSADGTEIAFISDRSGNWELWMANADGSDARKLTEMGHAIFPRWSPNDQRLLFSSVPQPGTVSSAFLLDSTGGFPINLLEDDYANGIDNAIPSWSEDTDWFYYQTQREDCGWQLWKRRLEGGDAMHLSSCVLHPLEGPDGRVYFFLVDKGVASVSIGGGETRLELPMSSANAWSAWTIWRQKLVYFDFTDFATKMLDLDTRETQSLYPANSEKRRALYGSLAVSPDGEWIIEARLDRSGSDLLRLDLLE